MADEDRKKLGDAAAKKLLVSWPTVTTALWAPPGGTGKWIQAQPPDGLRSTPKIYAPGSTLFSTQPDGMWLHFNGLVSCDVMVIEVCGSTQNLGDKRSRYMPTTQSLVVRVPRHWADSPISAGQGGQVRPRREHAQSLPSFSADHVDVPIRALRVLYALPNDIYATWTVQHSPAGHEYFMPHSALATYGNRKTQTFLKSMSPTKQFHTETANVRLPRSGP